MINKGGEYWCLGYIVLLEREKRPKVILRAKRGGLSRSGYKVLFYVFDPPVSLTQNLFFSLLVFLYLLHRSLDLFRGSSRPGSFWEETIELRFDRSLQHHPLLSPFLMRFGLILQLVERSIDQFGNLFRRKNVVEPGSVSVNEGRVSERVSGYGSFEGNFHGFHPRL